jgi:8-oxo-dGTP pyrophosphatase MutT (NUDIX family)
VTIDQYQVLDSQRIFTGRVISLRTDQVRMSDGSVSTREIVEHPGAVAIVAIDEADRVVLVRQYRHPIRDYVLELPAGLLDVPGESALAAAQRELFEEASLTAQDWYLLVDLYPSPGMSDEAIRVYLAQGLADVPVQERYVREHEEITMTVSRLGLAEAAHLALRGELHNATAVAGILAAEVSHSRDWADLRPADSPWPARPGR